MDAKCAALIVESLPAVDAAQNDASPILSKPQVLAAMSISSNGKANDNGSGEPVSTPVLLPPMDDRHWPVLGKPEGAEQKHKTALNPFEAYAYRQLAQSNLVAREPQHEQALDMELDLDLDLELPPQFDQLVSDDDDDDDDDSTATLMARPDEWFIAPVKSTIKSHMELLSSGPAASTGAIRKASQARRLQLFTSVLQPRPQHRPPLPPRQAKTKPNKRKVEVRRPRDPLDFSHLLEDTSEMMRNLTKDMHRTYVDPVVAELDRKLDQLLIQSDQSISEFSNMSSEHLRNLEGILWHELNRSAYEARQFTDNRSERELPPLNLKVTAVVEKNQQQQQQQRAPRSAFTAKKKLSSSANQQKQKTCGLQDQSIFSIDFGKVKEQRDTFKPNMLYSGMPERPAGGQQPPLPFILDSIEASIDLALGMGGKLSSIWSRQPCETQPAQPALPFGQGQRERPWSSGFLNNYTSNQTMGTIFSNDNCRPTTCSPIRAPCLGRAPAPAPAPASGLFPAPGAFLAPARVPGPVAAPALGPFAMSALRPAQILAPAQLRAPGPAPAIRAPVVAPIPVAAPVASPVVFSALDPATGPVRAPGQGPVGAPGQGPVGAPGQGPVRAPGQGLVVFSALDPVTGPVRAPGQGPVVFSAVDPVTGPVRAPGQGPVGAPGQGPVAFSALDPATCPILAPGPVGAPRPVRAPRPIGPPRPIRAPDPGPVRAPVPYGEPNDFLKSIKSPCKQILRESGNATATKTRMPLQESNQPTGVAKVGGRTGSDGCRTAKACKKQSRKTPPSRKVESKDPDLGPFDMKSLLKAVPDSPKGSVPHNAKEHLSWRQDSAGGSEHEGRSRTRPYTQQGRRMCVDEKELRDKRDRRECRRPLFNSRAPMQERQVRQVRDLWTSTPPDHREAIMMFSSDGTKHAPRRTHLMAIFAKMLAEYADTKLPYEPEIVQMLMQQKKEHCQRVCGHDTAMPKVCEPALDENEQRVAADFESVFGKPDRAPTHTHTQPQQRPSCWSSRPSASSSASSSASVCPNCLSVFRADWNEFYEVLVKVYEEETLRAALAASEAAAADAKQRQ